MFRKHLKKFKLSETIWAYLGYLLLIPSLLFNGWQYWQSKNPSTYFSVTDVVDGDTFAVPEYGRLRLANLEAPELDFCGGQEAKEFLSSLVQNKKVRLDIHDRDVYNRPVVYAYVNHAFVNEELLKNGWAVYVRGGGDEKIKAELKTVYEQAREQQMGIHGECTQTTSPKGQKCLIKGNVDVDDPKSKVYHFPGCSHFESVTIELYRGDQWFCTEKEAQTAGFKKSAQCFDKKFQPL